MVDAVRTPLADRVRAAVRDVPDFPAPGIVFKDITPVLIDPALFGDVVRRLAHPYERGEIDLVVGIESRGFIFAAPIALELGCGFVPVRKPGKLPSRTHRVEYELEYGSDALEAHLDAIRPGERVLVVDDVLATGGTAAATVALIRHLGGVVVGAGFLLELGFLHGRDRLAGVPIDAILTTAAP